jgi:hypothetical protein
MNKNLPNSSFNKKQIQVYLTSLNEEIINTRAIMRFVNIFFDFDNKNED